MSELCGLVRPNFGGDPARWSIATIPHERDGEDRELRPLDAKYKDTLPACQALRGLLLIKKAQGAKRTAHGTRKIFYLSRIFSNLLVSRDTTKSIIIFAHRCHRIRSES